MIDDDADDNDDDDEDDDEDDDDEDDDDILSRELTSPLSFSTYELMIWVDDFAVCRLVGYVIASWRLDDIEYR